jgi:hypothetical protein
MHATQHLITRYSSALLLFIILASAIYTQEAQAVPAYARQMGVECSTCHFQHFPKLNAFGRNFKATGYSQTTQDTLEGDNLSISPVLNAGFFIKTRVADDNKTRPTYAFPDEAALLVGGRFAEGMGGLVEMSDAILSYKMSLTKTLDSGMTVGVTPYATDGLGPAYGFELMNTGTIRNHRPFERSAKVTQGQNGLDLSGPATGFALHAHTNDFFVILNAYVPDSAVAGHTNMDAGGDLSTYMRAAWTPNLNGADVGIGFGMANGSTKATCADAGLCTVDNITEFVTDAMFIDAQYQGELNGKALGVYFVYAEGGKDEGKADTIYLYNGGNADAPSGYGIDAEYSMTDDIHLLLSYGNHDNGDATQSAMTRTGVGAYWELAQNLTVQPMYESFSGDQAGTLTRRMTVLMEAAF